MHTEWVFVFILPHWRKFGRMGKLGCSLPCSRHVIMHMPAVLGCAHPRYPDRALVYAECHGSPGALCVNNAGIAFLNLLARRC